MLAAVAGVVISVRGTTLSQPTPRLLLTDLTLPGGVAESRASGHAALRALPGLSATQAAEQSLGDFRTIVIPTPTPAPIAALGSAPPTPVLLQLYHDHRVESGDTLSGLAQRYGVSVQSILSSNPDVTDKDTLIVGQVIRVPGADGILYHVRLGDSLSTIAQSFGVTVQAIIDFAPNGISNANDIHNGQLILVPGGKPQAPVTPPPAPSPAAPTSQPSSQPAPRPTPDIPSSGGLCGGRIAGAPSFIWPAHGIITSYCGPSHPHGIDIDQYHTPGAPIVAASAGVVAFAGGDPCCGLGYYVEISHGNGWVTRYGHMMKPPPVHIGQRVSQGQVIGYSGNTGYSTGPHVHFEIRYYGRVMNPLAFLP